MIKPITTHYTTLASPLPGSPSFVFHLTVLNDTLFLWVGTGAPVDSSTQGDGAMILPEEKRLASDWAVAMPPLSDRPIAATSIYRGGGDMALSMSQRLAKRFSRYQIHLSLSLPPSLTATSGPSLDPFASKVLLVMEKKAIGWVDGILRGEQDSASTDRR